MHVIHDTVPLAGVHCSEHDPTNWLDISTAHQHQSSSARWCVGVLAWTFSKLNDGLISRLKIAGGGYCGAAAAAIKRRSHSFIQSSCVHLLDSLPDLHHHSHHLHVGTPVLRLVHRRWLLPVTFSTQTGRTTVCLCAVIRSQLWTS